MLCTFNRLIVGKMIELLGSKADFSCGRFLYESAFGEPSGHADKVEAIRYYMLLTISPPFFSLPSDIIFYTSILISLFSLAFSNFSVKPFWSMVSATMGRISCTQVFLFSTFFLLYIFKEGKEQVWLYLINICIIFCAFSEGRGHLLYTQGPMVEFLLWWTCMPDLNRLLQHDLHV